MLISGCVHVYIFSFKNGAERCLVFCILINTIRPLELDIFYCVHVYFVVIIIRFA